MWMRNALTHATHTFFQNNGFLSIQVPIITTIDVEGFNKSFIVRMLLSKWAAKVEANYVHETDKATIKEKSKLIEKLKISDQQSTGCYT